MAKFHHLHRASSAQPYQVRSEASAFASEWPSEWLQTYAKDYPRLPLVELPRATLPKMTLDQALLRRASERSQGTEIPDVKQLATLLESSLGLRSHTGEDQLSRRFYPSAGARFTTEAYVWISACQGLRAGLYYYAVPLHGLRILNDSPTLDEAKQFVFGADWISRARILIILSAVMWRSYDKYGERAYRYALLEAGHVMQNLCLAATALGLPLTPVGGFADVALWNILDIGDVEELPIYVAAVP